LTADTLLTVPDAVRRILADVPLMRVESVPLLDAFTRVLAADALSHITLPPWNNSAMDGYAVRSSDIAELPASLRVIETVAAGQFPSRPIAAGETTRVMTGAPVPDGADCVIRVEDTDRGTTTVTIRDGRDLGKNVRPRGEDIHAGHVAIPAGTPLGAAQIGVLASIGAADVSVYAAPRVAILTSGDELVELEQFDQAKDGRKIVSSNSYTLRTMVRAAGAEPVYLGIAADSPESLREHLARAADCDLIITSAGISVGEFDYVRDVLTELGAQMKFWRVRMRPGAPIGFGLLNGTPWIGLPGNPVSTMVTFELFARPAIRKMLGHRLLFRKPVSVTLEEPIAIHAELMHFLRAVVTPTGEGLTARLTGPQSSGILTSMSLANALLIVPPDRPRIAAGETLHAIPLGDDAGLVSEFAL
jgi:molybdopterin molybdotransferase